MTNSNETSPQRPKGSPAWIDLSTSDIEGAKTFYGDLFGWTFEDQGDDFGHYHFILRGGVPVGGLMSTEGMTCPEGGEVPTEWGVYLAVDDADGAIAAAESAGGKAIVSAMPVGDSGTMAVVVDPAGAAIGMWQANEFEGLTHQTEPGFPVWFECMSKGIDVAIPFYQQVFGWEISEMPGEWRYVTNAPEESATAGLGDAAGVVEEGTPSYWRVYLAHADLDGVLARLPQLGGRLLDGPVDSPFGRLATVADPQGASFQLLQPSAA